MKLLIHSIKVSVLVLLLAASTSSVLAQTGSTNPGTGTNGSTNPSAGLSGGLQNPLRDIDTFPQFLKAILGGVVQIGTIILIMMLVYVGFLFVAARGNAEKLQSAKSALVWTVIGGLILLGATTIQLVIEGTVRSIT